MECQGCVTTLDHITYYLLLGAVIPANLYVIFYLFRPWRSTPQGRALMLKAIGNALVLNLVFVANWFPHYPGRDWIRLVGFGAFFGGITYLLWSLLRSKNAHLYPPFKWRRIGYEDLTVRDKDQIGSNDGEL